MRASVLGPDSFAAHGFPWCALFYCISRAAALFHAPHRRFARPPTIRGGLLPVPRFCLRPHLAFLMVPAPPSTRGAGGDRGRKNAACARDVDASMCCHVFGFYIITGMDTLCKRFSVKLRKEKPREACLSIAPAHPGSPARRGCAPAAGPRRGGPARAARSRRRTPARPHRRSR